MLAVVIPAHDEEALLPACLRSVLAAAAHPALQGEPVAVVVVLDDCTDGSAAACAAVGIRPLEIAARNVGAARAAGCVAALADGARWIACTDADTTVAPDWLAAQLALGADAVCGTIGVAGWSSHGELADALRRQFETTYRDADGHRHVHGANLGFSADAYRRVGGFQSRAAEEDVALVAAFAEAGLSIAWSAGPRVRTSARGRSRAEGGFASAILRAAAALRR
jgi:glycosyltransferase involved in cell wall biosynthesis